MLKVLLCLATLFSPCLSLAQENAVPRTILALYDGDFERFPRMTLLHKYAEMPLNHLGYRLEYHNIRLPLPDIIQRTDVAGIVTWFPDGMDLDETDALFSWAIRVMDSGKKWVVVENSGLLDRQIVSSFNPQEFWRRLGLRDRNIWNSRTYLIRFITMDPAIAPFERSYVGVLPVYRQFELISPDCVAHVVAREGDDPLTDSCLVMTGPYGGMVAAGYGMFIGYYGDKEYLQWMINPFHFFRLAFGADALPKADTTTLAGRRMYYSHIDGDGWNSLTQLEGYRSNPTPCAEVIRQKLVESFVDLPFTIAPIAADIDLKWVGTKSSREAATKLFALPNVEVGCHTFTHPFDWPFFKGYKPADEVPFLSLYPNGGWQNPSVIELMRDRWRKFRQRASGDPFVYPVTNIDSDYEIPRAYALKPFDLSLEVEGAIQETNDLALPFHKQVTVYQWSGNCLPWEEPLKLVREAAIKNLNGGTTRFDDEYPSYAYVSALGRHVGQEQQIYASNSNENTYTELWTGRFYGFNKLPETFANTETPIRVRPMNLYFHMYSAERMPSLYAVLNNVSYIRKQEMTPVPMSHFAGIVEGFYLTEFVPLEGRMWKIQNRGELQTVRFDQALLTGLDFTRSQGVVGQRHFQGSLYVYLDASRSEPVIALKDIDQFWSEPVAEHPYLIASRWPIWNLQRHSNTNFTFTAQGFGTGLMHWSVPVDGSYRIETKDGESFQIQSSAHVLAFDLKKSWNPLTIEVQLQPEVD